MVNFIAVPKKKKKFRPLLLLILLLLVGWIYYSYSLNAPVSNQSAVEKFIVESGWGSSQIGQQLAASGLIRNAYIFQLYVWQNGIVTKLQSGEYFLDKNLSIKQIADILSRGSGETKELTLTFIEGWSNQDISAYLKDKGVIQAQEFFDVVQKKVSWWDEYDILESKPRDLDLEGYLFPDTYRVFRDASVTDVVRKMLDNLDAKLTSQIRVEIEKQGKTIHQVLTLASIVEKEVSSDKDRKIVAGIFNKRLEAGIALQADSTVNYVTGKSDARASAADLKIDSLYNTYKYRGLPPGPIANPSLSSIEAVVYSTPSPYFYFLTTPDGEVIYNIDFEGHVEDKNRYYR